MTNNDDLAIFKQSMNIGHFEWHEGIGYNLEVLSRLQGSDLQVAENLLVARQLADWRDVEALDRIGTERALAEISKGLDSNDLSVRAEALTCLVNRGMLTDAQIDDVLAVSLGQASIPNGLTRILSLVNSRRSPRLRKELLRTAIDGAPDARCHAAALAHFVHGGSSSMFDMAFRDLYLRFNSQIRSERAAALRDLCQLININADALLAEFAPKASRPWWQFW